MVRAGRKWSGRRGSNPRHLAWEASTLPTELHPHKRLRSIFHPPSGLRFRSGEAYIRILAKPSSDRSNPVIRILAKPGSDRNNSVIRILAKPGSDRSNPVIRILAKPSSDRNKMERVKRFELSTSSLARKRSSQLSYTRTRD